MLACCIMTIESTYRWRMPNSYLLPKQEKPSGAWHAPLFQPSLAQRISVDVGARAALNRMFKTGLLGQHFVRVTTLRI